MASSLQQRRAGGWVESSPKLVRHIGLGSTWAEELYPLITRSAAASYVRLRVFLSDVTSASMARRGYRASCSRPAELYLVSPIFSVFSSFSPLYLSKALFFASDIIRRNSSSSMIPPSNPDVSWGTGSLPSGTAWLFFCGILRKISVSRTTNALVC